MSDSDNMLLALARLEASLARLEENLTGLGDTLARLRRIDLLVEEIALGMGISPHV